MLEIAFILQAGILCLRANDSNVLSPPSATPSVLIKISVGRRSGISAIFWGILHICHFIVGEKQKHFSIYLGKCYILKFGFFNLYFVNTHTHTHIHITECCAMMEENRKRFVDTLETKPSLSGEMFPHKNSYVNTFVTYINLELVVLKFPISI